MIPSSFIRQALLIDQLGLHRRRRRLVPFLLDTETVTADVIAALLDLNVELYGDLHATDAMSLSLTLTLCP
jgi:hypothetical protein